MKRQETTRREITNVGIISTAMGMMALSVSYMAMFNSDRFGWVIFVCAPISLIAMRRMTLDG